MRALHNPFTVLSRKGAGMLLCLLTLSMLGSACRSLRPVTVSDSVAARIPESAIPKDPKKGCSPTEYNGLIEHVRDVRKAVLEQQCYKWAAEREAACAYRRVQQLEASIVPGRLVPGTSCQLPEPDCLKDYK